MRVSEHCGHRDVTFRLTSVPLASVTQWFFWKNWNLHPLPQSLLEVEIFVILTKLNNGYFVSTESTAHMNIYPLMFILTRFLPKFTKMNSNAWIFLSEEEFTFCKHTQIKHGGFVRVILIFFTINTLTCEKLNSNNITRFVSTPELQFWQCGEFFDIYTRSCR